VHALAQVLELVRARDCGRVLQVLPP
jgi:hypothetical protein